MTVDHLSSSDGGRMPQITRREALQAGSAGAALLMSPALLAACGGETGETASVIRGPVMVGQSIASQTFDPHTANTLGAINANIHTYEALYSKSPEPPYEVIPQLAAGDPEVSGTKYRIALRPDATFHDGQPVTAEDVVASIQRIQDPETLSLLTGFVTFIEAAEAEDERTVVLTVAAPTALMKDRLALIRIAPRSILSEKNPGRVFNSKPIGSGPYRMTSISRDLKQVRFERYKAYKGPAPFRAEIPSAGFEFINEDQPRAAAVETGRLHLALDPPFRAVEQLDRKPDLKADGVASFQQSLILTNCKRPPFDDARVRRALLHAIDREAITQAVFFGRARPAVSYLPDDHPDFKEPTTSVAYDPDRAKQLLAEAGVPDLKFEMLVSNLGWLTPQAPLIQSNLRDIGVDMKIVPGQIEAHVDRVASGKYEVWLSLTDPSVFGSTDGAFLIRWIYGNLAEGFLYWTTPAAKRLAKLLDDSERTDSRDRVRELVGEMQDIINEEAPSFPLHHRDVIATWSNGLEVELDPIYGMTVMQAQKAA